MRINLANHRILTPDITILQIENTTFSMIEYEKFISSITDEVDEFKKRQAVGVQKEEARYVICIS